MLGRQHFHRHQRWSISRHRRARRDAQRHFTRVPGWACAGRGAHGPGDGHVVRLGAPHRSSRKSAFMRVNGGRHGRGGPGSGHSPTFSARPTRRRPTARATRAVRCCVSGLGASRAGSTTSPAAPGWPSAIRSGWWWRARCWPASVLAVARKQCSRQAGEGVGRRWLPDTTGGSVSPPSPGTFAGSPYGNRGHARRDRPEGPAAVAAGGGSAYGTRSSAAGPGRR